MRIVIAAGGTGGHIFPAVAIGEAIRAASDAEVTFIGVGKDLEKKIYSEAGFSYEVIPFVPITGKGVGGAVKAIFSFPLSLYKALKLYGTLQPAVVLGCGGFPSVVPVLAAGLKKIPVVLQEQNVQVGMANKFLSLFARRIFASPGASNFWGLRCKKKLALIHLANPVRKQLFEAQPYQAPSAGAPLTLLILGGSQGAMRLNTAVVELIEFFREKNIRLIHQTGRVDFDRVKELYEKAGFSDVEVQAFIADMFAAYSKAQLVISRAGAMSVAELQATGRPAIFVPLQIAKSHQEKNVEHLLERGAALVVRQNEDLAQNLRKEISMLSENPERLSQMAKGMRESALSGKLTPAEMIAADVLTLGKYAA